MAIYTKISASGVGLSLSKVLGKSVGKFTSTAKETITSTLQQRVEELKQKITDREISAEELEKNIDNIREILENILKQLRSLQESLEILESTIETIKVPVKALKAALAVLKLIPLPQRWLIVAVTTVYSDQLEKISELIAQIEEIANSLLSLKSTLYNLLEKIIQFIENLLRILDLLKILHAVMKAVEDIETKIDSLSGTYEMSELSTYSLGSRDVGTDSLAGQLNSLNKDLQDLRNMGFIDEDNSLNPFLDTFRDFTIYTDSSASDQTYQSGLDMLDRLQNSGLSIDIKNSLQGTLNNIAIGTLNSVTVNRSGGTDANRYYTTRGGQVLTLKIVVDPKSPKIAPRRYVSVSDESGTVVYEGTKSFAESDDILIEETKVRLVQLFG